MTTLDAPERSRDVPSRLSTVGPVAVALAVVTAFLLGGAFVVSRGLALVGSLLNGF